METSNKPQPLIHPVAIVGGGITGLTAAFYLKRRGIPVVVYEATQRVGGVIESIRSGGYLAEFGPNTILETSPKITRLIEDAGLRERRLDPDPKAEARYVVRYKRPSQCPPRPWDSSRLDCSLPKRSSPCCASHLSRRARMAQRKALRTSSSAD